MKKTILRSVILIFILLIISYTNSFALNRIFLLDTSGSMKSEGLFDRIKETLINDYVSEMKQKEHIMVLTFDEKVVIAVDRSIEGQSDIDEVIGQIENLKATGSWTWMTKALQMTMEQVNRLKKQYPDEELNVYFLTDGINDPPPSAMEPPMKFVEVILNYFKDFKTEDANVYILVYKDEGKPSPFTKENKEEIEKETDGRVKVDTRSPALAAPLPPEIHIGHAGFDLGVINLSRGSADRTGTLSIKELKGDAAGKVVDLVCETESFPELISFKVTPDSIQIQNEGQIEKITIHVPQDLSPGEYLPALKLFSDDVLIMPNQIPVKFQTVKAEKGTDGPDEPFDWSWISKLLAAFLILAALYFLLLVLRTKSMWVGKAGQKKMYQIKVRNLTKESLKAVGLENYRCGFGIFPQEVFSVFLFKGDKREKKITVGESVKCLDPQGVEIEIIFHGKPSSTKPDKLVVDLNKKTEKEQDPDFFKKK